MDEDLYKKERPFYHRFQLKRSPRPYKYYDTPDGQDLLPKLWATTKIGGYVGFVVAGYDTLVRLQPNDSRVWLWVNILRRSFPFVIFPVVYTTTTYLLTNIRQKDEVLNANIGGAVAGLAFGAWCRNGAVAFAGAIAGAIGCGIKKRSVELGIRFPTGFAPQMGYSSWALRNLDFTLTKEVEGKPQPRPRRVPEPPPPPPPPPEPGLCAGF